MIAVAVSGGMDSLYALISLQQQGKEVLAVHGRFLPCNAQADPVPGLVENCQKLGIPLQVVDASEPFRQRVIHPFAQSYVQGQTPNPCALCNARMKFGLLRKAARAVGATHLATGHYACLVSHQRYGTVLGPAADRAKDQSYFLAMTPISALREALFPLAQHTKSEIKQRLPHYGLCVPLPKESQEICFVPNDDYRTFLSNCLAELGCSLPEAGAIALANDPGRIVGRHEGLWRYTEGQRRGLGIAWAEPLYVVGKQVATNTLLVGTKTQLLSQECVAEHINIHVPPDLWPEECFVRTRYRHRAERASVSIEAQQLHIRFHEPQTVTAPGQVAVVFDAEGHVLAGGFVTQTEECSKG